MSPRLPEMWCTYTFLDADMFAVVQSFLVTFRLSIVEFL